MLGKGLDLDPEGFSSLGNSRNIPMGSSGAAPSGRRSCSSTPRWIFGALKTEFEDKISAQGRNSQKILVGMSFFGVKKSQFWSGVRQSPTLLLFPFRSNHPNPPELEGFSGYPLIFY